MGAVGAAVAAWPFVATLGPAADTLALSTTEVDLAPVAAGQAITVMWRGKPVFIRHRTAAEIEAATAVDNNKSEFDGLRDKETDAARVKQSSFGDKVLPQWLVQGDLEAGRLVRLLADHRFAPQGIYAMYPDTRHLPLKVRAFIDFMKG